MKSTFQTIIVIIFCIGFVVAVAVFSGLFSSNTQSESTEPQGNVVIWGVLPQDAMGQYVSEFNSTDLGYTISYAEHTPETFTQDFINALADGMPPDVLIYSSEIFSSFQNKLYTVPYTAFSERTYRDTYIDGAQLFLNAEGVIGFPLLVDPLVVYYNKDILAASGFITPPVTWENLSRTVPIFTKRNAQNAIEQSTVALGDPDNVEHMRDILSALFLQTGAKIVEFDPVLQRNVASLISPETGGDMSKEIPTAQALSFYTSFANPTNTNYSWNRSLPSALQTFLAGKSAFYIGRASELFSIQAQNPNLNFDVQELFQLTNAPRPITFGSFVAVSMVKNAPNYLAAYSYISNLSSREGIDAMSKIHSLPPTRKDLLLVQQNNPYMSVFFRSANGAFSWADPNLTRTTEIFRAMITNVSSGRTDAQGAIYEAARDLQSSIR